VSTQHNPEFTMLEFYQAYSNYHDLMDLTQELIKFVANEVNGITLTNFNGTEIDLSKWTKLSMREAIMKFCPPQICLNPQPRHLQTTAEFQAWLQQAIASLDTAIDVASSRHEEADLKQELEAQRSCLFFIVLRRSKGGALGKGIAETFELFAEPHLIQPTIIYDFPLAVSPLSKIKPDEPDWVERFEFYIGGFEVGNAFSELNDPDDQRRRFEDQLKQRERGDDEAHAMDEDYVRALGYGLPPTAGEGIGIDRLTMILTGSKSIRDVILFPLMRPQGKGSQPE
jgi:lysyl-tRNA synthetase class 2